MSMNFYQFYDKLNGTPYENDESTEQPQVEPPTPYHFMDYLQSVSNGNNFSGVENGGSYDLKPLTDEDMAQAAEEDVMDFMKQRGNTTRLGDPLDDEGMRKYTGVVQ